VIRIHKSDAPAVLLLAGKKQRKAHCNSYSRHPQDYQSGTKVFNFDAKIYAHPSVKQALIDCQHQKCCFCEQIVGEDGDVEHFRPKRGYKQAPGKPLQRPGYYWLAYEWDNLFLACSGCNQRHKQNLFPLLNPDDRSIDHKSPNYEQPLFIDPSQDNPEDFISFQGERAIAINDNRRAQTTIANLKLNRRNLSEARLQYLKLLKVLDQLVRHAAINPEDAELQEIALEAQQAIVESIEDDAIFAAAARVAIQTNFAM
jgi:uncharacterized protein (TIGR02646 family)